MPLPIGDVFQQTMMGPDNQPLMTGTKMVWSNAKIADERLINRRTGIRFIILSDRHIQLARQILQEGD
jgi:hypothetical protein